MCPPSLASTWVPRTVAVAGCAFFLIHALTVIFGSESTIMQWLYDDCFYYIITAKHFSELHISSFDGLTVTSGYHPLWMWACAGLYRLHPKLDFTYVKLCMGVSLTTSAGILVCGLLFAWRKRSNGLLLALGLGASSYSALNNGQTVMEWPLVLLFWFLLHTLLTDGFEDGAGRPPRYAAALFLGLAGSFSRTDFGLIPASYLGAGILVGLHQRAWRAARESGLAVAGSVAGLPLIFLYNHHMTGSWLQDSAEIKGIVASVTTPFNPAPALWQFARVLFYLPALELEPVAKDAILQRSASILAISVLLLAACVFALRRQLLSYRQSLRWLGPVDEFTISASLLGVAGYLLLDSFNTQATYGWYSAPVTGFILLLAARVLQRMRIAAAAWIVVPLIAANIAAAEIYGGNAKGQMPEVYIGKAMHAEHPNARMGGGDVGKVSFYNDGTMVNLDGLMNNEVEPYLKAGRIHCYLLDRHIEYVYDAGTITEPIVNAERALHGEARLPWSLYLQPVRVAPVPGMYGSSGPLSYLKTNFDAIRASGECNDDARFQASPGLTLPPTVQPGGLVLKKSESSL